MNRFIPGLVILMLGVWAIQSAAASQTTSFDTDSLRIEAGILLGEAKELIDARMATTVDSARVYIDSAFSIIHRYSSLNDTLTAKAHIIQSLFYIADSKYDSSIESALTALDILKNCPGKNHIQALQAYEYLVACCLKKHDLVNCEHYSDRRFEILENLGKPLSTPEAEKLVAALNDRARLLSLQNKYDEAIDDLEYGLSIITDDMEEGPRRRMGLSGNIAWILAQQGKTEESEKRLLEVVELAKAAYHPKHPQVLLAIELLGKAALQRGDYDRADSLINVEIAMSKEISGESTLRNSDILQDIAYLRLAQGRPEEATESAVQAVNVNKAGTGDYPTNFLMGSLRVAGDVAMASGNWELARNMYNDLLRYRFIFLHTVFNYASETQKLDYIAKYPPIIHILLSGAATPPGDPLKKTALNMVLRGKGMGIDAIAAEHAAAICSVDPYLDSLIEEHRAVCSEIAGIFGASRGNDDNTLKLLDDLYERKDKLETLLSSGCSNLQLGGDANSISVESVAAKIPDRSVLWEFVRSARYDIPRIYEGYFPTGFSYLAMVLTPESNPVIVDLGDASIIDSLIKEYHAIMSDALYQHYTTVDSRLYEQYTTISGALYERLISPLLGTMSGIDKIYIAPDGMLNLLPFETLTGDGERYLVEDHECIYLTSGRDLLREQADLSGHDAFVIADPDYMIDPGVLPTLATSESAPMLSYRGNTATPECLGSMFSPLPVTRQEGRAVAGLLGQSGKYNIIYLESGQAREGILKNMDQAPDILHIATHGYFCEQAEDAYMSNPLLRSGLILAGANRTIGKMSESTNGSEDGILTAMEVSGLNLIGTELVVLSACQTGVGDIQNGEGVFGLRRAFQNAGAKSVVMSMFAVPDESTSDLMERFYENWLSGQSKSTALRNALLSILNERRAKGQSTSPLFWGGFIFVGDPD